MVTRELERGVLTLMLNRPEVGNALAPELIDGMEEALAFAAGESAVRVVVVTGAGKHFSAGADLNYMKAMRGAGHEANVADAKRTQRLFTGLAELPKPVVARVHGAARGGGVGLLAAADVVVASNAATFAFTEVRLGIIPAMIGPFVIARVGSSRARRLFLTAETFDAEQAEAWGLVDHAVPAEDLDAAVARVCADLVAGGPGALAEAKKLVRAIDATPADRIADLTAEWIAGLRAGDEGQEGMAAFLEKRRARWVP
ncbi:MAG TPA: enoyl-CoA hydratase-related protein [Candidatus Eisenbacteria bacterium]|nr:enoyl-CoA hydratase-related protein [Candidatus Eisenbacteria bacterium]